ncbi:MAG: YihY/virulence factor BrkB family protein [Chloroflexota bacterium]|nr:YihY/virulence factor BrkB family protein [Chloroflexota bacterium]
MDSLKATLKAFQRSRLGLFLTKLMNDEAPNLAALLAWGTLVTLLPLMLGILTVVGLALRDSDRIDEVYRTIQVLVPAHGQSTVGEALESMRRAAGAPAGLLAVVLLLFNGSSFFANMAYVFDQAYHVETRNVIVQRLISLVMLVLVAGLLVLSTVALGLGAVVGHLPLGQWIGPLAARVISWSLSIASALTLFVLLYKVLPNARQGWRDVLPGALLSTVLFFAILAVFPLYVAVFPPNQAYAVFGVFLVFTVWLYLLGWVFVLGAEVNAYLQQPSRSAALAEATQNAARGRADFGHQTGQIHAQASGDAPSMQGGGQLGSPTRSVSAQVHEQGGEFETGQVSRG